jgi:predicted HicB family RNase H-like nuclease
MHLSYRQYQAEITYCRLTNSFYGAVINCQQAIITFVSSQQQQLLAGFAQAVSHYETYAQRHAQKRAIAYAHDYKAQVL